VAGDLKVDCRGRGTNVYKLFVLGTATLQNISITRRGGSENVYVVLRRPNAAELLILDDIGKSNSLRRSHKLLT